MCYNNNVLTYYKNKFGTNSSIKTDASTQTDFSDMTTNKSTSIVCDSSNKKRNSSNKKEKSTKKNNLNIQECSNIEDMSINNIIDTDPNHLCDKLKKFYLNLIW